MLAEVESLVDLQSLSAVMSVSSCSSLSSSCRGGGALKKSRNAAAAAYENAYEEELYAFLDAKPEVDDRRRGGKKGRRHAADALLSRKLSRHAYLIKSIVGTNEGGVCGGGGGGAAAANAPPTGATTNNNNNNTTGIGKKRRVRLLSEHMEDFNVAVPYSLNRKNRWRAADDSATGCLKALAESASATTGGDERVRLSVVESYLHVNRALGDAGRVTAYREMDANGALLLDRTARSARGAPLKNLVNVARDASSEREEADAPKDADQLNVQYHFTRPHACAKVMGAHLVRMKGRVKSMRRMCYNVYPLMSGGGGGSGGGGAKRAANRAAATADDVADEILHATPTLPPPWSETENREEWIAAMYRQQPRRSFTLADFVVETSQPPVIVRRSKTTSACFDTTKEDIENQFVITDSAEHIPSSDAAKVLGADELDVDVLDDAFAEAEDSDANVVAQVAAIDIAQIGAQWAKRHNANFATFKSFSAPARRYAIHSADAWDALCAQTLARQSEESANAPWTRAWCQNARRLAVDASALFARQLGAQKAREAANLPSADENVPLLVLVFEYIERDETLKVLINGAFKCALDAHQLSEKFGGPRDVIGDSIFARLVEEVVGACVGDGVLVELSPRAEKTPVALCQKRAYHSRRFAAPTDAFTIPQIVERDAAETESAAQNLRAAGGEPFEEIRSEEASDNAATVVVAAVGAPQDELDDFEHIDMDEEFGFEKVAPKLVEEEQVEEEVELATSTPIDALSKATVLEACEVCGESSASKLLCLAACGHAFCTKCLNAEFVKRGRFGEMSTQCLKTDCGGGKVPLDWLQTVVPLPMASQFAIAHHLTRRVDAAVTKVLAECPDCGVFLSAANAGEFRHLACGKCGVVFCAECARQPHWPLGCKQSAFWAQKFEQQYKLNEKKRAVAGGAAENAIAHQFSAICCEARARRIDASTGWQLAKNFARLCAGAKLSVSDFGEARKAALYILEFGLAWLYMNRSNNNSNANSDNSSSSSKAQVRAQLKSLLNALYKKVESLDNELLFSGSLSDAQRVVAKAEEVRALAEGAIAKLKSAQ